MLTRRRGVSLDHIGESYWLSGVWGLDGHA